MLKYNDYLIYAQEKYGYDKIISDSEKFAKGKGFLQGYDINKRLSFTPYIYNICSANCRFCSEKLTRSGKAPLYGDTVPSYFEKLQMILKSLKESTIFLSLSGREPSESIEFVGECLKNFEIFEDNGGIISERVMYSNLSGAAKQTEQMCNLLSRYKLTRIEASRHHYNENLNQQIMNFHGSDIQSNVVFWDIVKTLSAYTEIRLACVLQKGGIDSAEKMKQYIHQAQKNGVHSIVFRELSLLSDVIDRNTTKVYIDSARLPVMNLLYDLDSSFVLKYVQKGYYYLSFRYAYENMDICFEMSDYTEMIKKHKGKAINKLIYYPDSSLCMDWNMEGKIF